MVNAYLFLTRTLICFLVLIFLFASSLAQLSKRIEGEFSIKKASNEEKSLTMGKFYYDISLKKLVFDIIFPQKNTVVILDTTSYTFQNKELIKKESNYMLPSLTVFHFGLSGELTDFGMSKSGYVNIETVVDDDLLITEWHPPATSQDHFGKIVMSQKGKTLHGILFYDSNGKLFSKQIFQNYQSYDGFMFPSEIINIIFTDKDEKINQLTTFRNVKVNNFDSNNEIYNYLLPD
ncbi:hypothetical protein JYT36_00430 [Bacteroidales bacterium AH-315-N07]|nr:hypothetical protein [Bacteroidales bacterium AH-315-N07]